MKYCTKSCRNFSEKFREIFRSRSQTFSTNISTTVQKYFPKDYKKCCVNIPTIIARKVPEKFLKYFVYGLSRGLKHFTKCFGKFNATFIEIFHASFLLRYLKHYTQYLAETFMQSFKKFTDLGLKLLNQYFHNFAEIFKVKLQEMLRKHSHYHCTECFWNFSEIFCVWFGRRTQTFHEMFWQVRSNIYWNISRKLPVKILETLHTKSCRLFTEKFQEIFRSRSDTVEPIFPQPCRNIYRKITRNVA